MRRHQFVVLAALAVLAFLAKPLAGQRVSAAAVAAVSGRWDSVGTERARKSPALAAGAGLVVPGSGHWYAGEAGRGTLIAIVYWSGVAVVAGGRTDRVGHIGGAALLGALGVSVIDGARAAARFNQRTERSRRTTPSDTVRSHDRGPGA